MGECSQKKKKKNDDDIATLSAVSKATSKKYLDDTGLGHLSSLIISFVRNYASPKTHNHDGVYAKSSHTHTTSQVTGLDSALAGKASTSHNHNGVYAPSSHSHSADNITSGVLPIGRGGTGATSARAAEYNIMSQTRLVDSAIIDNDYFVGLSTTPNTTSGATYKRTASSVWNYIKSKTSALYLPLTGGTVTGLLKTPGGTMVHNASGKSGAIGYVNIAEFNLAGTTYQNMPIQLDVFRRRMSMVTRLYIYFDPVATSDPAIAHLGYEGAGTDTDFYMYKSATSTWQLYIKKAEGYDDVGIAEYKTNFSYIHPKITFKDVQVSSVPSGAIAGKYCDAMRATAIKDAGDGRTLKMNYSADDLTNADRFAVWNGNTLQSMHKNTVRGVIGAAPASHTHDATNITSGTVSADRLPVTSASKGGTGKTTLVDSANALINSLSAGTDAPTDNDYYVCQFAGGGTTTTTYHRRSMSALWTWIKSKCDAVYQAKGSYAASSHTHNSIKDIGDGRDITFNYSADGAQDASWFAVWNGSELKSMSKQQMKISLGISSSGVNLGKLMYPVGAVYISWSSTSPASLFGGSWVAITGRFPYFNAGTGQGGSNTHTLSVNEMPSHRHLNASYSLCGDEAAGYGAWYPGNGFADRLLVLTEHVKSTLATTYSGNLSPHNNMPSYQTLYAWRRTG